MHFITGKTVDRKWWFLFSLSTLSQTERRKVHCFLHFIYNCSKNLFSSSTVAMVTSFPISTGRYKLLVYIRSWVIHLCITQTTTTKNSSPLSFYKVIFKPLKEQLVLISIIYYFHSCSLVCSCRFMSKYYRRENRIWWYSNLNTSLYWKYLATLLIILHLFYSEYIQ